MENEVVMNMRIARCMRGSRRARRSVGSMRDNGDYASGKVGKNLADPSGPGSERRTRVVSRAPMMIGLACGVGWGLSLPPLFDRVDLLAGEGDDAALSHRLCMGHMRTFTANGIGCARIRKACLHMVGPCSGWSVPWEGSQPCVGREWVRAESRG